MALVKRADLPHTVAMPEIADTIVADIVTEQQDKEQTVDQFTANVEKEAEDRVTELQATFGPAIQDLTGDITKKATSYTDEKRNLYTTNVTIANTKERGAAGVTNMANRKVSLDRDAMNYGLSEAEKGYWKRVDDHEKVHQTEQAATFNTQSITYVTKEGIVKTLDMKTFYEGQASEKNERGDLVPEYISHLENKQEFETTISGGAALVKQGLKSGDMAAVQEAVIEQQPELIADEQINVTVGADLS